MASHHCHCHNYKHRHHQTDSSTAHCCRAIDYNPVKQHCCPPPSPPPPLPTDQLLQTVSSYLLQSNPSPTLFQTQNSNYSCHYLYDHNIKYRQKERLYHQQDQDTTVIAALLYRVEALESSLRRYQNHSHGLDSLRDAAARVIQIYFRAFLVRRSRTLSQLKDLAFIKSTLSSLKSSISRDTHVNFGAISHRAMNLLLQLDSVQGDDPMVCDGKRSITRDLILFLDLIDGVVAKRHGVSAKTVKGMRSSHNLNKAKILGETKPVGLDSEQTKVLENLRIRVERISRLTELSENDGEAVQLEGILDVDDHSSVLGHRKNGVSLVGNGLQDRRHEVKPKVKKCVTFTENGNRLHRSREQAIVSEGGGSEPSEDMGELVKRLTGEAVEEVMGISRGSEADEEEALLENGGSRHLW